MRYKKIGIIACVAMLVIAAMAMIIPQLVIEQEKPRYHQHIEAEEKKPCNHDDDRFCTHLPIISIDTDGVEIPGRAKTFGHNTTAKDGSDRISGKIEVFDKEKENNHLTDKADISSDMTIHVRGRSSRGFDKTNYRIKLVDKEGNNNPQPLLGMDSHHEWALHGPFLDKTLMRNYMWYNIGGEIMDYAPNVRFCEVFVNGEYEGVYVLTETITAGDDGARLNVKVNEQNSDFAGYVLLIDSPDDETYNWVKSFTTYALRTTRKMEVKYPGKENLSKEIVDDIEKDFSGFEKSLYSYDYKNDKYGYDKYIDVDSFVDYFLINEFTCNYDAGALSTYIYKDIDGKYRMCIWDFNNVCDNYMESHINSTGFRLYSCLWYYMLFKDEKFTERVIERYRELRKTYLSDEYLLNYIDETVKYLGDAVDRNYKRWGYTFDEEYDMLTPEERNPRSYEESIEDMKEFIVKRGKWMDENIESIRQYSAMSKVKKFNEVTD